MELHGVSLAFGGLQAVEQVSFEVPQGSIKAVIGPNGAGKTTLFNLVTGFLAPQQGRIVYQGRRHPGTPGPPHRPAGASPAPFNWCNSSTT